MSILKMKFDSCKHYLLGTTSSQYIAYLLLIILCILAFFPALNNDFVYWDDQYYVTSNPYLINPNWSSFKALWIKIISLNYHPLTMISLWINAYFSDIDNAFPFIATNIIIHILNSILCYHLAQKLCAKKSLVPLFTALVFAIHPMHVESVVWVSERKDVLYAFFFFSSLLQYVRYLETKKILNCIFCCSLFLFACLSKAMAVSLLPSLFLIDYLQKRKFTLRSVVLEKAPFVALAILFGLIAIDVQAGGNFHNLLEQTTSADAMKIKNLNLFDRLYHAMFSNFFYLKKFILPDGLSPMHPYSIIAQSNKLIIWSINLTLLGILLFSMFKQKRNLIFGISFYLFTIVLVLQWMPVGSSIVSERYTYLPYFGLAFSFGVLLEKFWVNINKTWLLLLAAGPILVLLTLTRNQCDVWQNHKTLFGTAVHQYPNDPLSRKNLASGLWKEGKLDSAIYHLDYAINELNFVKANTLELLANCYADLKNQKEALHYYNEAIKLDSTNAVTRYHRALLLLETNPALAIQDLNFCEQSKNDYVKPLLYAPRSRAFAIVGELQNALLDINQAIQFDSNNAFNYLERGVLYENMGRAEAAIQDYKKVIRLDSKIEYAKERLSLLEIKNGN